ncbi:MAG: YncE family protein [Acidobacteriia bacterium]|nr:YncE family protein [Terriglobia bacterium]
MIKLNKLSIAFALLAAFAPLAPAQESAPAEPTKPLVLTEAIPMPGVQGRFDHFATDGKGHVFVSSVGSNTVEVIDVSARVRTHTITGIPEPQGLAFAPEANKLYAGSGEGKLYIYDGTSYDLVKILDFGDDVDNLRYDAPTKRVYAGYGGEESGAISAVDTTTNERISGEFKLGAHPESFQIEKNGPNIYVNLPDLKQIAVINRSTQAITRWPLSIEQNFPMALDEADHRLFVVTHQPARLAVFNTQSGKLVASLPCVQEADEVYFDAARKRIYIPGAEAYISVFQEKDPDHFQPIAKIPSALGARTAGYFGKGKKGFDRFFLAVPARSASAAEMWIYSVQD